MTNLSVFRFKDIDVRFVGTADSPEWVAQDVCFCLELTDTSKALGGLDDDEKGAKIVRTLGGSQEMLTVTEAGLYHLIFKSRKPVAKSFKRWVLHDVLPSIRKTGSYSTPITPVKKASETSQNHSRFLET
ncbi:MAG TPA: BRO family protein, partial [Thermosynechococcaceae cyanobacterium]